MSKLIAAITKNSIDEVRVSPSLLSLPASKRVQASPPMTSSRERTRKYRERQKLAGYRSLEILVTGNTYEALMKLRAKGASWEYIMKRLLVKPECSEALGPFFKDLSRMAARQPAFKRLMRAHGLLQATG